MDGINKALNKFKQKYQRDIAGREIGYVMQRVDLQGNVVERTKEEYPYSYDSYVVNRYGENDEINNTMWSDRLKQWDHEKFNECWERHCEGENFKSASKQQLTNFLRDYTDDPQLELIVLMESCNQASGFPLWIMHVNQTIEDE